VASTQFQLLIRPRAQGIQPPLLVFTVDFAAVPEAIPAAGS
jgi:hypothetical protein